MARRIPALAALLALHALAREVDGAVGVLLHTTLDLPGFVAQALALLEPMHVLRSLLAWMAGGLAVAAALAWVRGRFDGTGFGAAFVAETRGGVPLLLRPALTALALVSLAVRPTWPYGFTLPVALTQDWGPAQDVAAAAALIAARWRPLRWPAPGPVSFAFLAFLAYALVTPRWAFDWEAHPGNEPKTLRMALALGHGLTLDVEAVSARMEDLPTRPLGASLSAATGVMAAESAGMLRALVSAPASLGLDAIRATPITRQTIRGKDGGVYYVLAPGPSLVLAPLLRADRALNRWRGTPDRLTVTVLAWNALSAGVALAMFLLLRDATRRPRLAAVAAAAAAMLPPALFYSYQFYPEMLAAGVFALAWRLMALGGWWSSRTCLSAGVLLAVLPWLHQKFLPVWAALVLLAVGRAVHDLVPGRGLAALLLPQAATLYLTALYNYAITGSVRPDAVFQAWGFGVSTSRVDLGIFGLLFDARYGLGPYVPAFLLAAGGLAVANGRRRFPLALLAAPVYFLTVAAADNWAGPISNLGRFLLPLVPVLVLLGARALAATVHRPGVRWLALTLAGWSAIVAVILWRDPHAANDCALLLARSSFADGGAYIPNLYVRAWGEAPPGTVARLAAWVALTALLAAWLRRCARGAAGGSAARALAATAALLLGTTFLLERWPLPPRGARFPHAIELGGGTTVFVDGPATVGDGHARATSGRVALLVRSREPLSTLLLQVEGEGVLLAAGQPAARLPGRAVTLALPLETIATLTGRRGARETLARQTLHLSRAGAVVLRPLAVSRSDGSGPRR